MTLSTRIESRGLRHWLWLLMLPACAALGQSPQVSSGRIERLPAFASQQVPARNIDVWLPEGYPSEQPYAVLYMMDGQMLFDADSTWNHQEWRADEVAAELIASGRTRPFIIVGVWNGGERRHVEYFPQRPFESLNREQQQAQFALRRGAEQALFAGPVDSDAFLRFLVSELKPYIDQHYAVRSDPANTVILGSSMGGLISLYALSEYPQVFGAAACLSTHWPGSFESENNPLPQAFFDYFADALPDPASHRLYFDHGTATLDAQYPALQAEADAIVAAKGYDAENWRTRVFPGAEHNEAAWAARLAIPLQFLLAPD